MSNTRRRLITALGCLLGSFAFVFSPALAAENPNNSSPGYSVTSFRGDYAVVGTYGASVARLIGTYHADGNGNIKGTATVNIPGPGLERVVVSISYQGTYTMNDDGTGVIYFTVVDPSGATAPATLDFVIAKAEYIRGVKVATEITSVQREPSSVVDGQFVTHVSTRRPDTKRDGDGS